VGIGALSVLKMKWEIFVVRGDNALASQAFWVISWTSNVKKSAEVSMKFCVLVITRGLFSKVFWNVNLTTWLLLSCILWSSSMIGYIQKSDRNTFPADSRLSHT
jgi:hypothetical protein